MPFEDPTTSLPASAIEGQIPGSQIDGPFDGDKLTPGSVSSPALAPGGIQFPHLESAIMASVGQKWFDFGNSASKWSKIGTATVTSVSVPEASGGTAMRVTGYAVLWRPDILIPYDPRALYRVSVTVRQTVASVDPEQQRVYIGLVGVASDGTTLVNTSGDNTLDSQAYCSARGTNLTADSSWQTFTGYVQGYGAINGDGGPSPSLLTPMKLHPSVRYVMPLLYVNYAPGTGTCEIDNVSVEVVPTGPVDGAVHIMPGTIIADRLSADAIDGKTITGVVVNGGEINGTTINGVDITGASTVTGATVQTGATGQRIVLSPDGAVRLHSGAPTETDPAVIESYQLAVDDQQIGQLSIKGPSHGGFNPSEIRLSVHPDGQLRWEMGPILVYENYVDASAGLLVNSMAYFEGDILAGKDVSITQAVSAGNIRSGRVSLVTTAANTPASVTVSGLGMYGANPRGVASPSTTVPGTQMLGLGVTNVTLDSLVIWGTRTNTGTSTTGVDYIVIAS